MPSKHSSPVPARAAPGRPRSEEARRTVLEAAHALFDSGGLQAATIEAIAARAGVAKTTIYRRWPNRASLLVDLLVEIATAQAPAPSVGKAPMRALSTELRTAAIAVNGIAGRLMASLVGEAQQDADVRTALLEGLFYARTEATAKVVAQAQSAGLIRADVPPRLIVDMLIGPLIYRLLVQHELVTERFAKQVFDTALDGLRPLRRARR
ncbi:MAG: TetR/AcrR family transcriptional regulator [bacterium]